MFFARALPLLASALLLCPVAEASTGRLRYRVKLRLEGETQAAEGRFTLFLGPVASTANKVKKPRFAPWQLEATQADRGPNAAMLLARSERLLYFAGPGAQMEPTAMKVRYGGRTCRIWTLKAPPGVGIYAFFAEVAPDLLALAYLSGRFAGGDMEAVELQLEDFQLGPGATPAEGGQALLATLQRLAQEAAAPRSPGEQRITE